MALYVFPRLQTTRAAVAMLASFIPYGIVLWAITLVIFLVCARGWWRPLLAIVAAAALVVQVLWTQPYWPRQAPAATGTPLRVLSLNLLWGQADLDQLNQKVAEANPDVVILLEYTASADDRLKSSRLVKEYPYSEGFDGPDWWAPMGTIVRAKRPLTPVGEPVGQPNQYLVRLSQAKGRDVVIAAAHPENMVGPGNWTWLHDAELLRDMVRPSMNQPVVAMGDLNAVAEHITLRQLDAAGLKDGAAEAGMGWQPTFPAQGFGPMPPVITIDHVLVNDKVTVQSVRTFKVAGTDHLGLIADLSIA
ncbi:endonuclease/exonuclease/phosphatase family protein [Nigerium massiliense]|uniref:endonuclease/exonuclease/phosphatase family protein n=1 Tax=Nigerium massiliense TaxID=1522317 RepID=UPI00058E1745|nr:endonuclease/exonuclease/phosphatase family protein [Nigerium massiliense]